MTGKVLEAQEEGLTRDDLVSLMAAEVQMSSAVGEHRGAFGKKVALLEKKGLVLKIYKAIRSITRGKNPAGQQAAVRELNRIWDLMGGNDQKQLELIQAQMPDTRTELEKQMDGETDALPKDRNGSSIEPTDKFNAKPMNKKDDKALATYRKTLKDADDPDSINRGMENFITDHPHLEDYAINLAQERLANLAGAHEERQPEAVH